MTEKRFEIFPQNVVKDGTLIIIQKGLKLYNISDVVELLNALNDENEQLKKENKLLQNKYERKDRQLQRTKKDIEKYTDYFMNELNWDCDRIIQEVFK